MTRIIDWFESLTPHDVTRLGEFYAEGVRFKDPFNEVQGATEVQRIFAHMFVALSEPRFVIHDVVAQGDQCFLTWDFTFRFKRLRLSLQTVHGASHLKLDTRGRITLHRDYWDPAEEMYEKLPALGALMRWLKRRAKA